ncbi:ribosomal protein l12 [Cystoisospora suis]|uniref:Ribosomal protein l12 n=1 Tax=Cystoisospora suis TaxID=483139 RepID=A0A2C6L8D6_9APIC|nr:ribosomal protein l12 [Cystoisospora suis]
MRNSEEPAGQGGFSASFLFDAEVLTRYPTTAAVPPSAPARSISRSVLACCQVPHSSPSLRASIARRDASRLTYLWNRSPFLVLFFFFWPFLASPLPTFLSFSPGCLFWADYLYLPSFVTLVVARQATDLPLSTSSSFSSPLPSSLCLPLFSGVVPARPRAGAPRTKDDLLALSALAGELSVNSGSSCSPAMPGCGPCIGASLPSTSSCCLTGVSGSPQRRVQKTSGVLLSVYGGRRRSLSRGGGRCSLFLLFDLPRKHSRMRGSMCPYFPSSSAGAKRPSLPEAGCFSVPLVTSSTERTRGPANIQSTIHPPTQHNQSGEPSRFPSSSRVYSVCHSLPCSLMCPRLHDLPLGRSSHAFSLPSRSSRSLPGFSLLAPREMRRSVLDRAVATIPPGTQSPLAAVASPSPTSPTVAPVSRAAEILEEIKKLTIVETVELVSLLESAFGVSARMMAAGAVPAMGAAGEEGEQAKKEEEKPPEKTEFDLIIKAVPLDKRIAVIKTLRTVRTDLGLKEAKAVIDALPNTVLKGVDKAKAEQAQKVLADAGAEMSIE